MALVITPTNATLYCGTNNTLRSAVDTFNQPVQTFGGATYLGLDVSGGESARTFNGSIDDVAIFDRALSESEILALFTAGVGTLVPLPVEIHQSISLHGRKAEFICAGKWDGAHRIPMVQE